MDHRLCALTPPMGWNSWDCYGAAVNEEQLLGNAAYMAKYLKPYGWEYVVCDIQWYEPDAFDTDYTPLAPVCLDAYSRLVPAEKRFPSAAGGRGFAPIAAQIHAMGLKFGIHIMRGIPRQAVHARMPVMGGWTADQVADPFSICAWNSDMYGVKNTPQGQAYYDSLFALYAEWGVDYVKVDDLSCIKSTPEQPYSARHEIEMIRKAIDRCGRPMVYSLSPGPAPLEEAWHLGANGNLWRMTDDLWDDWGALKAMFRRCELWQFAVAPGNWPDCDMLPVGHLNVNHRKGSRYTRLTHDEQITMMNLWCIFRSPLMVGAELRDNDTFTLDLLTNRDVLEMHRHAHDARQLQRTEEEAVWRSQDDAGNVYLALFNLSDTERTVSADLPENSRTARDLWSHACQPCSGSSLSRRLAPHASAVYRVTAESR